MLKTPPPAAISAAILDVRARYQAQGLSLYDIGNGSCYDFAEEVMNLLFPEGWIHEEGHHDWQVVESETLFLPPPGSDCTIDATAWDWDLLERHWSIQVASDARPAFDAIVPHGVAHCWLYFAGRHYDCEHPGGVQSFFDLNFFRRWLKRPLVDATI